MKKLHFQLNPFWKTLMVLVVCKSLHIPGEKASGKGLARGGVRNDGSAGVPLYIFLPRALSTKQDGKDG